MMGTKPIYNRMLSKHFMYTFNDKCLKNVTNEHIILALFTNINFK